MASGSARTTAHRSQSLISYKRPLRSTAHNQPRLGTGGLRRDLVEIGREIIRQDVEKQGGPERTRIRQQHFNLRADVFAGKVKVAGYRPFPEDIVPLALENLRPHYPEAHELMITVAELDFPVALVFREEDLPGLEGEPPGNNRVPTTRPISKQKAREIGEAYVAKAPMRVTQGDLWRELNRHGECPRSLMREVAKHLQLNKRGRPKA